MLQFAGYSPRTITIAEAKGFHYLEIPGALLGRSSDIMRIVYKEPEKPKRIYFEEDGSYIDLETGERVYPEEKES